MGAKPPGSTSLNAPKSAIVWALLGVAVLAGFAWFWMNDGPASKSTVRKDGYEGSSTRLDSETGMPAAGGATAVSETSTSGVSRDQEEGPPSSVATPVIYEDWISRSSLLTGTPNVGKLFQVLDALAVRASTTPTSPTTGQISFSDDPNTVGEYSVGPRVGGVEAIRVTITTTAPQGSVLEDTRFNKRYLDFEFGRPTQSSKFSCQVNLVGREMGRMTPGEREEIYGSSPDPIRVGFRVTYNDTEIQTDQLTLQIRQEADGAYLPWLVGGHGEDAIIFPYAMNPTTLNRWRQCLGFGNG